MRTNYKPTGNSILNVAPSPGLLSALMQDTSELVLPRAFFTDLSINNAEEIKRVQQPLLRIHRIEDNFLSITTQGEVVYNNYAGSYKEAYKIPGAGHSNVPDFFELNNYLKAIEAFVKR